MIDAMGDVTTGKDREEKNREVGAVRPPTMDATRQPLTV